MEIRLVRNEDIDKTKWNSCVHYSNNGNIFGYKWFLDFIAKDWDALVEKDYESVFPLTWQKNFWGQKHLHQPTLIRELGIYSINVLSEKRIRHFLQAIPPVYKKVSIALNEQNRLSELEKWSITPKVNYQLWLKEDYDRIESNYESQLKSVYQEGQSANLTLTASIKPESITDFYLQHGIGDKNTRENNSHQYLRIMYNALHRGWGSASGVFDKSGELLAVNFFLFSHGKAVNLIPVESKTGSKLRALDFLFDLFIRSNANRPLILDFNDPNPVWEKFGATPNHYYQYAR